MSFEHVPSTSAVASALAPFRTNADDLVNERFEYALNYATQAFIEALDLMDQLRQLAGDLQETQLEAVPKEIPFARLDWLAALEVPDWSNFDYPDPLSRIDWSVFTVPTPNEYGIDINDLGPVPPIDFSWDMESIFSTDLLAKIIAKISTDVSGGTGISSAVRTDMINSETEMDVLINETARTNFEAEMAEFGWEMPDGVTAYGLAQIEAEYQNKRLDKARSIRIEDFNLAQKNIQFAVSVGVDIKGKLMAYQTDMMNRKLDAAKFTVSSAIERFKVIAEYVATKVRIFEAVIDGFKARVGFEGDKAKTDLLITQADLENVKLVNEKVGLEIEKVKVESIVSNTEVERVKTEVELFDSKVKQASTILTEKIERARVIISQYMEQQKLRLSALGEAGKVAATVAAGALTGVSAQAHISSSDSLNASGSVSYQGQETKYTDETPSE